MNGRIGLILLVCTLLQTACASPDPIHERPIHALRGEIAQDVPALRRNEIVIPHQLSAESLQYVRAFIPQLGEDRLGARGLVDLLFDSEFLGLRYEWAVARNADTTLAEGGGNCLSLGAVVVAVARAHGGAARYIEIDSTLEEWQLGDIGVVATHIGVLVPSVDGPLIIDFSGQRVAGDTRIRVLSDRAAVAHYYNDRGYELIWQARRSGSPLPWAEARRHFALATKIDSQLGPAWNNLGVAHARLGDLDAAELAYQRAQRSSLRYMDAATVANLASLESRRNSSGANGRTR
jgi:tetratricopeptide (TPR) repeat protein